jgi:hypothetical protein
VILGVVVAAAWAEPTEVGTSFTEDFEIRYWTTDDRVVDNPDRAVLNYVEQVNRLNAAVIAGRWVFEVQVDEVALFANRYYLDDALVLEHDLLGPGDAPLYDQALFNVVPGDGYANPEKVRVRYEAPAASLVFGDAYVAFGRGIGLNLARNVDIDLDTSVQGVRAALRPGAWDVTLVAGQINRQQVQQDNPNVAISGDRRHALVGARAERFGLGPANVGGHVAAVDFVDQVGWSASTRLDGPDAVVGGATLDLAGVGGLDISAEGDIFGFPTDTLPGALNRWGVLAPGYGLYASMAAYPGPVSVLVEGKRYYRTERINALTALDGYEIAVAPTLEYERAITEDTSAALNSDDIGGGRVQVDVAVIPGRLVPYAATAVFRDVDVGGLHFNDVPETIVHPMLGLEWLGDPWAVLLNAGVRVDDRAGTADGADRLLHADIAVKAPVAGPVHVDVASQALQNRWGDNALQQADFFETKNSLTVGVGAKVAFIGYLDHTDNPLVTSTGNLAENLYGAAELQVKPSESWTLKLFGGAYAAGIRCAGGQCRQLPGFEGARFAAVGSF